MLRNMLRRSSILALVVTLPLLGAGAACQGTIEPEDGGPTPNPSVPSPEPNVPTPEPTPTPEEDGGFSDAGPNEPEFDAGPSPIIVDAVTPPDGPLFGGERVRVDGDFFTPESRLFFGDNEADQVLFLNSTSLTGRVPQGLTPGPVRVCVENELGRGCLAGGYTYFSPVTVTDISPNTGSTAGGEPVTLTGEGFTPDMIVLIGGRQAVDLEVAEDRASATLLTPPADIPGRADVEAIDTFGRSVLALGFTYNAELSLTDVEPRVIESGTTPTVDLFGSGFDDAITVEIGGQPAAVENLINSSRVRVRAPAGLTGSNTIVVTKGAESATLEDALYVVAPGVGALTIDWASPLSGDIEGDTVVFLAGEGFTDVTSVTVGGTEAEEFTILSDRSLSLVTPAGTVGPADIEVVTASSSATFTGFGYLVPLDVDSVDPASGPAEGGTAVTISGRNFGAGATVTIGGIPALDVVVVDDTTITATTPSGTSGPATVAVVSEGTRATLAEGFLFETDLKILSVRPARGGISGNTFVTISGAGFSRGTPTVTFGQLPATDVTVVSDNLLHARTPFNQPGVVNVVLDRGAESDAALQAFTYFNPANVVGGTRGGQVNGAVYLTALDSFTGAPIEGGVAFLGTQGGGISAVTNIIGQATLSGPEVVGPQTVSIIAEGYEYATVVDVDAAEVTLFLQPLNLVPQPGGGTPPPPPIPPTIRGRVFGFAKEFFDPAALGPDEIAVALVVTTARDEFSGTPNPGGENAVFAEGGEFFIANARVGRLAVVALAGIFNLDTGEFRMRQMGVRRNVYTEYGTDLVEQDIELTISLDQNIDLSMPDAPVQVNANGPTVTRVLPFLRFGGEGALAYTSAVQVTRNHPLQTMPDVPGELLTFIAGAYTTDGAGLVTEQGTLSMVAGEAVALGTGTNWDVADFFGNLLVEGAILVVDGPGGQKWATTISRSLGSGEILLETRPPFSATNVTYHIGNPTYPSSEVVQDGVGDLIGGVTIQPVLGIPEPTSPSPNGVLQDRTLRWRAAPGQQPTVHLMYVYDPVEFANLWTFYVDGSRTKVPLPRLPDNIDELGLDVNPPDLRAWGYAWQHTAIYSPGLDFENFSYIDIGTRSRRAWTTNVNFFTFGGE